jgi:AcrR family transcriptional regulator
MEDIAQEGGVSRATVYLYFRCKEEIAMAWLERHNLRLHAELKKIALRQTPPADRLREILFTRVLFRFQVCQPYIQSIDELLAALRQPLLAQRERNHEEEARILAEVLEEGAAQEEFTFADSHRTAHLLILATNALMPYSLSVRQLGEQEEIESKTYGVIRLLLEGLHRRESSPLS